MENPKWGACEPLADAHCHLQDCRIEPDRLHRIVRNKELSYIVVNGCSPDDWSRVLEIWKAYPDVILPQLGLHPWWVYKQGDGTSWLDDLQRLLEEYPMAGLGECGLDASGKWMDSLELQEKAFKCQIQLAISLGRPLSVHCVKAYGRVLDYLSIVKQRVPILLHGWGGSAEMTRTCVGQLKNVYFSINLVLIRLDPMRASRMLKEVPKERFVLESDSPDGILVRDRWEVWLSCLPQLHRVAETLANRIQQAHERSDPHNVILVAHIVAILTEQSPRAVMATSMGNVEQIFKQHHIPHRN